LTADSRLRGQGFRSMPMNSISFPLCCIFAWRNGIHLNSSQCTHGAGFEDLCRVGIGPAIKLARTDASSGNDICHKQDEDPEVRTGSLSPEKREAALASARQNAEGRKPYFSPTP
jgi:hypothetical protein